MDGSASKISFIPKSPLVREDSFLERPRPRSVIGGLAVFAFLGSVGAYGGFYFYDLSLAQKINSKTEEVKTLQEVFNASQEVKNAKVFRSRAELAKELLDRHTVVSPVLAFLSENTVDNIYYDNFLFAKKEAGWTLELMGEAPSYATLAYQGDVFRKKTAELSDFTITDITLTNFGTVTFTLNFTFVPSFLSYVKEVGASQMFETQTSLNESLPPSFSLPAGSAPMNGGLFEGTTTPSSLPATSSFPRVATSTETTLPQGQGAPEGWKVAEEKAVVPSPVSTGVAPAAPSWWSKFKFW